MDAAFIGLGQMGSGMSGNLVAAGHQVTVWNRDRTKAEPFAARGTTAAADLAAAARAGTVMTMTANDAVVETVSFGDGGLLAAGPDLFHISCSTVSVDLTARLAAAHAAAGQRFVSAQVLGRPDVAAAGKLSVIAAGAAGDLDVAQPLFDAIRAGWTARKWTSPRSEKGHNPHTLVWAKCANSCPWKLAEKLTFLIGLGEV